VPATTRPLEAQVVVRLAEPGGRAVERKLTLPVVPAKPMIGVKPLFSGRSLGEGDIATFDVVMARRTAKQMKRGPALRTAQGRVALSMVSPRRRWTTSRSNHPRRRRHDRCRRRQPGRIACR
jgi:uncharacterized protein YfaS (alpha-2-macroglobulin family)